MTLDEFKELKALFWDMHIEHTKELFECNDKFYKLRDEIKDLKDRIQLLEFQIDRDTE